MPRRETPGHRGLSSVKKTRVLNREEWWPNEAKLVDPAVMVRLVTVMVMVLVVVVVVVVTHMKTAAKMDEEIPCHKNAPPRDRKIAVQGTAIIFS